jgi:tRNA(Ile)-lysidine synthase
MAPHLDPALASLVDTVRATVARERLFAPGERVLVAVSGGADSVALLHVLVLLRGELGLDLRVAHVHHGLRAEADRDAEFVRGVTERLGCPFAIQRVAVARGAGRSPEEAARIARLAALARMARAAGAARVALGHTADDQAETVLMRALQGAGPRGLAGMPIRRGPFVRPLLDAGRAAVLQHLRAHDLGWVEDASNQERRFLRNRIRHDLLPAIETRGWPQLRGALRRMSRACREAVEALDALLAPEFARSVHALPGGHLVDLAPLRALPPGAAKSLLRRAVLEATPGRAMSGLRAHHLAALHALAAGPPGAIVRLPRGLTVERSRHGLWISPERSPGDAVAVAVPGETCLEAVGLRLSAELVAADAAPARPAESRWEAWFDQGTAPLPLVLRHARRGDRVVPFGAGSAVRVSRVLAAAGYPRRARLSWPVVVAGQPGGEEVLWVVGVRRAYQAPVTPATRTVLRIRAVAYPAVEGTREESS